MFDQIFNMLSLNEYIHTDLAPYHTSEDTRWENNRDFYVTNPY